MTYSLSRRTVWSGVVVVSLALVMFLAPAAKADVVISSPRTRACLGGRPIKVGVWYQEQSGGPRWYTVRIRGPRNRVVFFTKGKASADGWRYWRYYPTRTGTYTVSYKVPGNDYRVQVRVRNC
jgi:hypothetical protein